MSRREYIIPFIGLKLGEHHYEFEIKTNFFNELTYSLIEGGEVAVKLAFEKKETMMIGHFSCEGKVFTNCDRCNTPVEVPVKGAFRLVFKLSTEQTDDESLIVLSPETFELDVHEHIYELIIISLPLRSVHPKGECDEEMMEVMSQYVVNTLEEDDDLDWDDEEWDEEEDDFFDDEDFDDDQWEDSEEEEEGDDSPDRPIDPRWSALQNLN